MSNAIIQVENLGKRYRIQHQSERQRYTALRDVITEKFKSVLRTRHSSPATRPSTEDFWALKDVSFEVKRGEVLGIIGRNGAGKSTLLKILSRITEPTEGRVRIKGRVASLLEVGTGFHPELTGRENIFLNGAILGMTREEIKRKFDEIVAFAEVEKFLDTPVKRYSSGMYVRLAFAVAAHLEPEILIVDEVLAVGDAEFQKKCLGKMSDVAKTEGRAVIFVSHNMNAVTELCGRALLLESGKMKMDGSTRDVVAAYLSKGETEADVELDKLVHGGPQRFVRLSRLRLLDQHGCPTTTFMMNEPFVAHIELLCKHRMTNAEIGLKISSRYGAAIHYLTSTWEGLNVDLEPGVYVFEVRIPQLLLFPGTYVVGLWALSEPEWSDDLLQEITTFIVLKGDVTGYRTRMEHYSFSGCEVHTPSEWKVLKSKTTRSKVNRTKHAVILVAGEGKRLRPFTVSNPKCFAPVAGRRILDNALLALAANGCEEVRIVTGHLSELIRATITDRFAGMTIHYIENLIYQTTNSMYSLSLGLDGLDAPVWVLEGDVFIEHSILSMPAPPDIAWFVDSSLRHLDGAYVESDSTGRARSLKIIRDLSLLQPHQAKSVSMLKLTRKGVQQMQGWLRQGIQAGQQNVYYDLIIGAHMAEGDVHVVDVAGRKWFEIDSNADLQNAERVFS